MRMRTQSCLRVIIIIILFSLLIFTMFTVFISCYLMHGLSTSGNPPLLWMRMLVYSTRFSGSSPTSASLSNSFNVAFTFENASSIGFKSGEYGRRKGMGVSSFSFFH